MKRTIGTILVALAAIFLFTGCDAVLEAFYPDFTDSYSSSKDAGITLSVSFDAQLYGSSSFAGNPVRIRVVPYYDMGNNQYYAQFADGLPTKFSKTDMGTDRNYTTTFKGFDFAKWAVFIWIDANDDNIIGYDEISAQATIDDSGGETMVDYRYELHAVSMTANVSLNTRIDTWVLDQLNTNAVASIPTAQIVYADPSGLPNTWLYFQATSQDSDGWAVVYRWYIQAWNNTLGIYEDYAGPFDTSDYNFAYSFPTENWYQLWLYVQDNDGNWSTNDASREVYVSSGYVNKQIRVQGSMPQSYVDDWYPTIIGVIDRSTLDIVRKAWVWDSLFDYTFDGITADEYFVVGWIDLDGDEMIDSNEPGAVADNTSQSVFDPLGDVFDLNITNYCSSTIAITDGTYVPGGLVKNETEVEAAFNASYALSLIMDPGVSFPNRNVQISLYDYDGFLLAGPVTASLNGAGYLNYSTVWSGLGYAPSPYQDYVMVYVDGNGDGDYIDVGFDYYAYSFIYLSSGNTTVNVNLGSGSWY